MPEDPRPEPDAMEGAPHPRLARRALGHPAAEAALLAALSSGRLHHAWLFTGPRGVGKATLAWSFARTLLAEPADAGLFGSGPESLEVHPEHPVARRVAALSEPRLLLLRRAWDEKTKRLRAVITVEEARRLGGFFHLSSADGGRRVVLVDAADDMNDAAANALLKLLEEPPANAVVILISHAPSRLLPTIRSRCRELRLSPLATDDLTAALEQAGISTSGEDEAALAELAQGSAGRAVGLISEGGLALYSDLLGLLARAPGIDRPAAIALAESVRGNEARRDMLIGLSATLLARLARTGAGRPPAFDAAPGEAAVLARLAPGPWAARGWADLEALLSARAGHAIGVNLDPVEVILDRLLAIDAAADRLATAA